MEKSVKIAVITAVAMLLPGPRAVPTIAQMGMPSEFDERTAQTASYVVKIRTGPKVTMSMSTMTVTDQGKPVNRHLEVHIFNRKTRAEVKEPVPEVRIADQATGASRALTNLMACRISKHREVEPHFGDNVYLPDGR